MGRRNTDFKAEKCALRNLLKYANFEGYNYKENVKLLVMLKAIVIQHSETLNRGWLQAVVGTKANSKGEITEVFYLL